MLADIAYRKSPLLAAVESSHAVTAFMGIVRMSVGVMRIIYRAERRSTLIEPDSLFMIVNYVVEIWLLFRLGR
jgi:hypothetical protein